MNFDFDLMIDSASRPELFKRCIDSIVKHVKTRKQIKWILHEAVLIPEQSAQVLKAATESKLFSEIIITMQPKGQGYSIDKTLRTTYSRYFIHWEDDTIAVRDIPLDDCELIMDENQDVNQIVWHKRSIMSDIGGWSKKEVVRSDRKLTTSPHWRYMAAVWRRSWILPRWQMFLGHNSHWDINNHLKGITYADNKIMDADWIIANMGCYYLGGIGEPAYTLNIGGGLSNRGKL